MLWEACAVALVGEVAGRRAPDKSFGGIGRHEVFPAFASRVCLNRPQAWLHTNRPKSIWHSSPSGRAIAQHAIVQGALSPPEDVPCSARSPHQTASPRARAELIRMTIAFVFDQDPFLVPTPSTRAVLDLATRLHGVRLVARGHARREHPLPVTIMPVASRRGLQEALCGMGPGDSLVVVGAASWATRAAPWVARRLNVSLFSLPFGYYPLHVPVSSWQRALFRARERRVLSAARRVLVQSDAEAADARKLLHSCRPLRLPLGFDPERARHDAHSAIGPRPLPERYALWVGEDVPNRRLFTAQAACSEAGLSLVQVTPRLSAAPESDAAHVVVRPGTRSEYLHLLSGAACLVNTSRFEAYSPHLFDALAVGVPFVSTATGPALDLSAMTGCPVVAPDADPMAMVRGFAQGLATILHEPPTRASLEGAAEAYAWDRLLPFWLALLNGDEREPPRLGGRPRVVHAVVAERQPAPLEEAACCVTES